MVGGIQKYDSEGLWLLRKLAEKADRLRLSERCFQLKLGSLNVKDSGRIRLPCYVVRKAASVEFFSSVFFC